MSKTLNTFVTVHDADGQAHTFAANEKVPKWAREIITNPNVWASDRSAEEPPVEPDATPEPAPEPTSEPVAEPDPASELEVTPEALVIPPKAGRGSSADAWRDYAGKAAETAGLRIEFDDDAKRDDIITALEEAQIPTE